MTKLITETAKLCIPNTDVTIKPQEPNWMNSDIKQKIRQRKRNTEKPKDQTIHMSGKNSGN